MPTPTATRPRRSLGLHRYATVLRAPHARQLALGGLLAYVGEAGTMFAVLLAARAATGSFATAGTAFGATVLGAAAGRIPQGRLIDRVGLRPVLLPLAALQLVVLVVLASALSAHAGGAMLVALAALAGATLPAMVSVTRTLWSALLSEPEQRSSAYALDATLGEVSFMIGPALAGVAVAAVSPRVALLAMGAFTLVGTCVAIAGAVRPPAPRARERGRPTVLSRPLVLLTAVALTLGLAVGVPEVVVPAFATAHGAFGAIGALIAAWGTGSMLGGLWFGTRSWRGGAERRLVAFLAAAVVTLVPPALAGTPLALGILLLLAGLPLAPAVTTLNLLVDACAPRERATEAFAWVGSALAAGIACGTTLAGWVVANAGVEAGFVVAALLSTLPVAFAVALAAGAARR